MFQKRGQSDMCHCYCANSSFVDGRLIRAQGGWGKKVICKGFAITSCKNVSTNFMSCKYNGLYQVKRPKIGYYNRKNAR